nr:acetyl-CoA carboxylase biotin carboxyl carrier protein subunit [Desulfobacterales bacterium]
MSDVFAPMVGKIIKLLVKAGDSVNEDDEVAIMEAMKMEMPIVAPCGGTVKEVKVSEGQAVEANDVLMTIE